VPTVIQGAVDSPNQSGGRQFEFGPPLLAFNTADAAHRGCAMPAYRCFFLDPAGRIFGSDDLIECETDTQAQACADRLLATRGFPGVEVWDCERKVYSARKTAAPS
jgi:hypothetical protein